MYICFIKLFRYLSVWRDSTRNMRRRMESKFNWQIFMKSRNSHNERFFSSKEELRKTSQSITPFFLFFFPFCFPGDVKYEEMCSEH